MNRIIAQSLVAVGQVFARAFASAYKQAAANAARGGAAAQEQAGDTAQKAAQRLKGVMEVEEAYKILEFKPTADIELDEILKRCDHLYSITDKESGGSLYLQSKIYRAREAITLQHSMNSEEDPSKSTTPTQPPIPPTNDTTTNTEDTKDKQ